MHDKQTCLNRVAISLRSGKYRRSVRGLISCDKGRAVNDAFGMHSESV